MTTLTFQNTTLSVINQHNQIFVKSSDLGLALGYKNPTGDISKIYDRNADEFTAEMTALIEMPTAGGIQKVRIFSLRGAHLIAMFARTKVAKDFRKWVLDILDREILQNANQIQPLVERKYTFEFTEYELEQLVWLWCSHSQMNTLLGQLEKPLEAIGSRFSAMTYSHHHEYKRHYLETKDTIARLVEPFQQSERLNWTRAINLINRAAIK
ncbi:P22AR C-terminal domain-containing protein [Haemophilus parahaemolyticus]|uniref:P22AR C-terminal domain-containing protein n=1 Tax=Haemophilus parahaemolyticus TaxID=735 RepID=UPI00290A19BC|nr:P22AR C-terminal domain-containing protein [Haemophilus parahaemolyticus]MDU4465740.1 P22AR C-terminal domain-containing protein [Haemophilus parahaemolyticus]